MTSASVTPDLLSVTATALQAQLQVVFPQTRFQFSMMPPRMPAHEWERLVNRPPFVGLGFGDATPVRAGAKLFHGHGSWSVFLISQNSSGVGPRYFGDAKGPGVFPMVQAAIAALNGWEIPKVGPVFVTRVANAFAEGWNKEGIAMAVVDLVVGATFAVPDCLTGPEIVPATLTDIATSWNFDGYPFSDDFSQGAP